MYVNIFLAVDFHKHLSSSDVGVQGPCVNLVAS